MLNFNCTSQNIYDSPISLINTDYLEKKKSISQEDNKCDDYLNLKSCENSFEFEDNYKELKFDIYSTEESKNNSNKLNINSGSTLQNNIPNLNSSLNANNFFDNEESFNLNIPKDLSLKRITNDQILESFFTCKLCKKILYSPFICKTCGESACHSCFGKSNKNELNNKSKKYDNSKFNFCKFCKNENVNIMPNFKVLQLKEDMCKNFKNYPYLENSSAELINKVKEYTSALMEFLALNDNTNENLNSTNIVKKNDEEKKENVENSFKKYNVNNNNILNLKNRLNNFANFNSFFRNNCFINPSMTGFPNNLTIFKNSSLYERFMEMAKLKCISNMNNFRNQNFIFNNFNNNLSLSNINNNIRNNNHGNNNNQNTSNGNAKSINLNVNSNGNSSVYNTHTNFSNDSSKNYILINAKFFIVRSIYKENLEISKKLGLWATTPFNENKLREAYRNSFVILLFTHSNNSLFYGCAIIESFKVKEKISEKFNNDTWKNDRGIKLGNLFKIIWLSDCEIPIYKLRAMNNPLNKNIPVLRSKDCQEVPYSIGSYVFKICESFSRKNNEEINYEDLTKNIEKRKEKEE